MVGYSRSDLCNCFTDFIYAPIFWVYYRSRFGLKKTIQNMCVKLTMVFALMMFLGISTLSAQSNDDCLTCHDDPSLTSEKPGKKLSRYVPANALEH